MKLERCGYSISTDPARLDRELIWEYLRTSYWAEGIPRDVMDRSIDGSLCFGLYAPSGEQAGFARAVTDGATFAWIGDLFVLDPHRGQGLGVWLTEVVLGHAQMQGLRKVVLATADAHGLYQRFGFERVQGRGRLMELSADLGSLYGEE